MSLLLGRFLPFCRSPSHSKSTRTVASFPQWIFPQDRHLYVPTDMPISSLSLNQSMSLLVPPAPVLLSLDSFPPFKRHQFSTYFTPRLSNGRAFSPCLPANFFSIFSFFCMLLHEDSPTLVHSPGYGHLPLLSPFPLTKLPPQTFTPPLVEVP